MFIVHQNQLIILLVIPYMFSGLVHHLQSYIITSLRIDDVACIVGRCQSSIALYSRSISMEIVVPQYGRDRHITRVKIR